MYDNDNLTDCFRLLGLESWHAQLQGLLQERSSVAAHGDIARWQAMLDELPTVNKSRGQFELDAVTVGLDSIADDELIAARRSLVGLAPWRKGPFNVCGIAIDAEWRSNLKWDRLQNSIADLSGRNVLDVGCGNGYYALRMRGAGARCVLGVDPTLLHIMQFSAIRHFMLDEPVCLLPLRLHELPATPRAFDTTFSMGVLYHQRSPVDHLRQLKGTLRQGGQLVLETLYIPGEESYARTPVDRYARMRNVWHLPTVAELTTWLVRSGYCDIAVIDKAATTTEEQRSTEWMSFESLREALEPNDPTRTVEGWPAPQRVVVTATAP
jgi:tRNA (mo5U34)-methyltransferase